MYIDMTSLDKTSNDERVSFQKEHFTAQNSWKNH